MQHRRGLMCLEVLLKKRHKTNQLTIKRRLELTSSNTESLGQRKPPQREADPANCLQLTVPFPQG